MNSVPMKRHSLVCIPSFPANLNGLITELLGFDIDSGSSAKFQNQYLGTIPRRKQCEKCGMTLDEFLKAGKVGCSNCYTAFDEKLNPLIRRLQGVLSITEKCLLM